MDEKKKAADDKVALAEKALSDAQAELTAADDAGKQTAQGKVDTATSALTSAKAERADLDADDNVDDIIDDANKSPNLKDGTAPNKPITVPKEKFDDLNEKAKLFEQFGPVLAKLKEHPELVDRLMAADDPNLSVADRVKALEDRALSDKRSEITETITLAQKTWPDFKSRWNEVKPILNGLTASGVPYADAVQRAYFAVNPEAVAQGKRLVQIAQARARENDRGRMSGAGGGGGPIVGANDSDGYKLSEADQDFAKATGIDPKLYEKHKDWIDRFSGL